MPTSDSLFISHRKWFTLAMGAFSATIGLLFDLTTAFAGLTYSQALRFFTQFTNPAVDVLDFLIVGLPLFGLYLITVFMRSRRIEFYENHARISGMWPKSPSQEVDYSSLELGVLRMRVFRGSIRFHFKLKFSGKGEKVLAWDVTDGKLRNSDETLYAWLKTKATRSKMKNDFANL